MTAIRLFLFSLVPLFIVLPLLARDPGMATRQNTPPTRTQGPSVGFPLKGENIFRNYCVSCHGADGKGAGPAAPALKAKVPSLTTLAKRNGGRFPAAQVRAIVAGDDAPAAHGSRKMPVWGPIFHQIENDQDLGYVRLQNVTEYLRTLQQK